MLIFEYLTFTCTLDKLQELLSKHGAEGWRLHTCTPGLSLYDGSSPDMVLVVMDKAIAPEEPAYEPDAAPEGIKMTG